MNQIAPRATIAAILFNCQPANAEPDWSLFDAIEVSPVARNEEPDGTTSCEVIFDGRTPDMWSVYGHYRETPKRFGVDCLTDCATQELAEAIGTVFRARLAT